ncbi:hypothetical protein D3C78_1496910 [compost metagenome]
MLNENKLLMNGRIDMLDFMNIPAICAEMKRHSRNRFMILDAGLALNIIQAVIQKVRIDLCLILLQSCFFDL